MSDRCEKCRMNLDGGGHAEGCSLDETQTPEFEFECDVREVCDDVAVMLVAKNRAYGNSALDPMRVFSRASVVEQLLVRIDDKLSRLARGSAAGEDVERDLMGYLVLLRVARKREADRG